MKVCLRTLPALLLLLTLGCITSVPPTPDQIASADYGPVPVSLVYQHAIRDFMQSMLFEPDTARYRFLGEPQKGYAYLSGTRKPPVFGYLVQVGINATNMKGSYVGKQPYQFFIKNNTLYLLDTSAKAEVVK